MTEDRIASTTQDLVNALNEEQDFGTAFADLQPDVYEDLAELAAQILVALAGKRAGPASPVEDSFSLIAGNITPAVWGHLLLQLAGSTDISGSDPDYTVQNKQQLLHVAQIMGPDHAQELFHIAKFLTKVA